MNKRSFLLTAPAAPLASASPAFGDQAWHANRDSRITLIYLGQVTCPACSGYEAEYSGRMDRMSVSFPMFKEIDYQVEHGQRQGHAEIRPASRPPEVDGNGDAQRWICRQE